MLYQPRIVRAREVPVVCCECGVEAPHCNLYSLRKGQGWEGFSLGVNVKQTDGSHRIEHIGRCGECVRAGEEKK
jgi:hypothetical protein